VEPDEYRRLFELENRLWWFRGMRDISMALVERYLARTPPRGILDAGCGTGGMLSLFDRLGPAVGIDASSDAIAFAKTSSGRRLVRGDVGRLPFAAESFDLVTSFDVLYHRRVRSDEAALVEIARVLRSEGIVLLRVPAFDRLRSRHDAAVHTRQRYGKREVRGKLERAGLTPLFLSFANCALFPVALLRRLTERFFDASDDGSEVRPVPGALDEILYRILRFESRLMRHVTLPFGLSIVAVARKDRRP
jgi:SAM-dependent methyltransferase